MNNKLKRIQSEISSGELLDKISILEIKLKKIKDKENLKEINKEYAILKQSQNLNIKLTNELKDLFDELKKVNLNLWDIEDKLRICEKNNDFGKEKIDFSLKYGITLPLKKYKSLTGSKDSKKRKFINFLSYRGWEYDLIIRKVNDFL